MRMLSRLVKKAKNRLYGNAAIRVSNAKECKDGPVFRAEALVCARKLWFESETTQLKADNETWASAFYFTALKSRRPLIIPGDLDVAFLANLASVRRFAKLWWGFEGGTLMIAPGIGSAQQRQGPSGIFFTGGVDSFYSLQRRLGEVRYLINVEGFDIPISDAERLKKNRALIDEVAGELGLEVIRVRTNLREHFEFARLNWEITHIAALASVGHLLTPVLSKIYVASSDVPPPWGSHPDLDILWSSSRLQIENDGSSAARLDKVSAIRDWHLVARFLKVCWENKAANLNCGYCEKCVRTQAQFFANGLEHPLSAFPHGNLVQRVKDLPSVKHDLWKQWTEIGARTRSEDLKSAIAALMERSTGSSGPHAVPRH